MGAFDPALGIGQAPGAAITIRRVNVDEALREGLEAAAARGDAPGGGAAQGCPVVAAPAGDGLESLRGLIASLKAGGNKGITLRGDIGLTSHFGDLLRRSKIPSRIKRD